MSKLKAVEAPRIYPTLRCADAEGMILWLKDVFGFTEHFVNRADGAVRHAQLAFGSSILMLGQLGDDDYSQLVGEHGGRRSAALYVAVSDLDAVYAKVRAAGAAIEMDLYDTDYGSREFACRDPEGNLWSFGTYWPKVTETPVHAD